MTASETPRRILAIPLAVRSAFFGDGTFKYESEERSTAVSMQLSEPARAQQIYCMALADYSYKQLDGRPESRLYLMREFGIKARYVPRTALSCSAPQDIAAYGPDRFGGTICACSP